jgi:hypothetical protein
MYGLGVGDVQPGQPERGDPFHATVGVCGREQHRRRPGRRPAVGQRDGEGAQLVRRARHRVRQGCHGLVERPPPPERHPVHAELGQHGRVGARRHRCEQPVEPGVGEQAGQRRGRTVERRDVEPLRTSRRELHARDGGQPCRAAQRVGEQLTQLPVQLRAGEARLGRERDAGLGVDGAHQVDVRRGGSGQHRVGGRARPHAAAVRLERHGGDQPSGEGEPFLGAGRSVQHIGVQTAGVAARGERERPAHRPVPSHPLLDGLRPRRDVVDATGRAGQ